VRVRVRGVGFERERGLLLGAGQVAVAQAQPRQDRAHPGGARVAIDDLQQADAGLAGPALGGQLLGLEEVDVRARESFADGGGASGRAARAGVAVAAAASRQSIGGAAAGASSGSLVAERRL